MDQPADDYDTPWKTALMRYFRDFMAFFFPQAHDAIDWRQGYTFLDQELAQVVREARLGKRRLDKLVRVVSRDGASTLLYIHIEIQRRRERDFAERMFTYNYRLYDRFRCPVASLAVLADPFPAWRPDAFVYQVLGCEIAMHFPTVKLIDYWPRVDLLLASENPFALLTAAHLITLHTRGLHRQRFTFKVRLTELMYQHNWAPQRIMDFFGVLDWMMALPSALEAQLKTRIDELNRRYDMPFESALIQVLKQRALEDGLEEGREKGHKLGREEGHQLGREEGRELGREEGRKEGWKQGREEGREEGWKQGREEGREEGREQAREEGRQEGLEEGRRTVIRKMLQLRFGPLPAAAEQRILLARPNELSIWEDKILSARTLEDAIGQVK